jgi:protein involved in polysaccharide export with SLBB domain
MSIKSTFSTLTMLAITLVASACSSSNLVSVLPKDPAERALTNSNVSAGGYLLNGGDRVRVTVFDLAAETSEYTIDDTGAIAIAALDPLVVKGGTTKDAGAAISAAYARAGLYRNARVSVDVVSFGPFYVLGEITKPGEFAYRPGMSLFAAVALAGGHTYRANRNHVYIRRAGESVETEYEIKSDLAILPGDIVRIPELELQL